MADIERRLALFQQQGVSATQEVQIAARKVAQENQRLRELLHHHGVSNDGIAAWLQAGESPVQKYAGSDSSVKQSPCSLSIREVRLLF
jgi:hypothetical protein